MSEEIQHASSTIPRSMFASVFINGVLGLATVIATCFCLGSDPSAILATETGYPVIEMFRTATGSNASASGMTAVLIFICFAATVNVLTSGSRMLWAFARERGLPFSAWLSRVHSGRGRLGLGTTVPLNAIVVFCTVAVLLSLINVGSAAAFSEATFPLEKRNTSLTANPKQTPSPPSSSPPTTSSSCSRPRSSSSSACASPTPPSRSAPSAWAAAPARPSSPPPSPTPPSACSSPSGRPSPAPARRP